MTKRNRRRLAALPAIVFAATAACGSGGDDEPSAAVGRCDADRVGGTITMGVGSETRGLDPVVSTGSGETGGTEMTAIYDTLMRWNPETGGYEPRLAESLEPNDDHSEWTLTLREGIEFGNGDPFTTEAVAASIDRHKDPDSESSSQVFAARVAEMEIIDDLTMVFRLVEPWADFPYVLADEPGMVPNPAIVGSQDPETFNVDPGGAGAGPYEVVSFTPGEEIVLEAKPDYWDGPVCVEQLRFVPIEGGDATYDAFLAGEIDVAYLSDPRVVDRARQDGVATHSDVVGGQGILINNGVRESAPPTTDIRLRRAILHALDPETIGQRSNEGTGQATSALFPEGSPYNGGFDGPSYDPDRARSLVEEVRAEGRWDGRIRLTCQSESEEQAIAVKAMLDAVGFEVELDTVGTTADVIQQVLVDANYDLACWSVQLFEAAPWIKLDRYLRSDSPANRAGYADPRMDDALDELRIAVTLEDKQAAISRIQEIWNETGPTAVLGAAEPTIAFADHVEGLTFNQETMVYFDDAFLAD